MPRPPFPVHLGVKRIVLFFTLTLIVCASLSAAEIDPKLDRAVRDSVPVCEGLEITYAELALKLPQRFTGALVNLKTPKGGVCDGVLAAVFSPTGGFFLGAPWLIEAEEGTITEKLKAFTWRNMQLNVDV